MGKVIKGRFKPSDNSGYMLSGRKVTGVYMGDLAAEKEVFSSGEQANIFSKETGVQITALSIKEMNQFCLMWLCMFDPDVIKEDD